MTCEVSILALLLALDECGLRMRFLLPFFSFREEISPTLQLFRQIDLDKDGLISKDDVKIFLRQFDLKLTKNNLDILAEVGQCA